MFFKSIRWRLQLWYGLILLVVLGGFGVTAYQLERGDQFRRIDGELQRRAGALANAMRPPPRERGPGDRPFPNQPRPADESFPGRPFSPRPPNEGPPGEFSKPMEFHLPPPQAALFDEADTNAFYYVVGNREGEEIGRSSNAPEGAVLPAGKLIEPPENPGPPQNRPPEPARTRGMFRESSIITPPGERILVGRFIGPELNELRGTALQLAGVGGVILFFGLVGGWWIATRALRPIQDISSTAQKISGGDLSQRINIHDTENELGQLASVLNSTFARLDASFAQQTRFTADAAHELRTPVSVMLMQTQGALTRDRSLADYRETIEACQRAAQRMRGLIGSLLELARLDAGQENMKRMSFDLATIADDCTQLVEPLAAEHGIKIERDLSACELTGDSERIAQVITNLVTNAIHYNHENGFVRVAVKIDKATASLTVTNSGEGIPAADLPRIFERFYRADQSRSSGQSGLGLAICKAIVEAHGGSIEATSKLGEGTVFTVRLPKA